MVITWLPVAQACASVRARPRIDDPAEKCDQAHIGDIAHTNVVFCCRIKPTKPVLRHGLIFIFVAAFAARRCHSPSEHGNSSSGRN